jgi:deoxyribonuclease-1
MLRLILTSIALLSLSPLIARANDSTYKKVVDELFWPKLYKDDFTTLYCDIKGDSRRDMSVEHVYPASWIAEAFGCKSSSKCENDKYKEASSDLHNLWPAKQKYISNRRNVPFGEIPDEKKRFKDDKCDFERTSGKDAVVEPRDAVKGQIARSYLHMIHWYDLPAKDILPLMLKWHLKYKPTEAEINRQDLIEKLQGRRNEFIKAN